MNIHIKLHLKILIFTVLRLWPNAAFQVTAYGRRWQRAVGTLKSVQGIQNLLPFENIYKINRFTVSVFRQFSFDVIQQRKNSYKSDNAKGQNPINFFLF